MEIHTVLYLLTSIVITSLLWFMYVIKLKSNYSNLKNNHENLNMNLDKEIIVKTDENVKSLQSAIVDLKSSIAGIKHESYLEGYEKARNEFSIKVYPYKKELKQGDDGWIINDIFHKVKVGYQYQLFVNGIPILQPATVIEQTLTETKREVDYNKVSMALDAIESKLLPIVAESKGLIKLLTNTKTEK